MFVIVLVIALGAVLAFANGANDNSKGVATLVGFGSATPKQALEWAALTTAIGAGFSFWFASGLIAAFKAKMFSPGTALDSTFFAAVLIGANGWVLFATRTGPLISTLLVYLLAWPMVGIARRYAARCVCVTNQSTAMEPVGASAVAVAAASTLVVTTGTTPQCEASSPTMAITSSSAANFIP